MVRSKRLLLILGVLVIIASTATALFATYSGNSEVFFTKGKTEPRIPAKFLSVPEAPIRESLLIQSGDTLQRVIEQAGLDTNTNTKLIAAISKAYDVRKLRAGTSIVVTRSALREPRLVEYQIDHDHLLEIVPEGETFETRVSKIPSNQETVPVCAELNSSLFQSIEEAGENPELAIRIAEIFAWDIDFYTDPQPGDDFCVLVEKKTYQHGQAATYGRILAATYDNAGQLHDAFLFEDGEGKPTYYSSDGRSTQAAFLRSPLKFAARVSSHFSHSRFHPVLKIRRPHLGTDYAAPTGTPVQSVASGKVVFSGRSGGAGNLVRIQHANGFETLYMHLSRRQVRLGQKVEQGTQIGLVGSTGLATGPHLDFRIRKGGRYLNFERLELPRERQVEAARMKAFLARRGDYLAMIRGGDPQSEGVVASAQPATPIP